MTEQADAPITPAPSANADWHQLAQSHGSWIASLCLVLLTFLTFSPSFNALFVWYDKSHILTELDVRSIDGLRAIWLEPGQQPRYEPLTQTTYWLEYQIWGAKPAGYHFDNVLLQALTALILFSILRRMKIPGAWVIAAVFAIHPIQAEAASWIGGRATLLGGFWYAASAFVFLRLAGIANPPPVPAEAVTPKISLRLPDDTLRLFVLATVLFLAALASDASTATLPWALLLIIWWKRPSKCGTSATLTLPLLVPAAAAIAFDVYLSHSEPFPPYALFDHIKSAGPALAFYLSKLAAPINLSFEYPPIQADALWPVYLAAAAAALLILFLLRHKLGRGPFAAAVFFILTLLPTLGFLGPVAWGLSPVADRYQHLACIGPIAIAVAALAVALRAAVKSGWLVPPALPAAAGIVTGVLALLGMIRSAVFRYDAGLWHDVWTKNPNSYVAAEQLGEVNRGFGEIAADAAQRNLSLGRAVAWYQVAEKINPRDASAFFDEGLATASLGDIAGATELYRKALAVNPKLPEAHLALGVVFFNGGDLKLAEKEFRDAAKFGPNLQQAHAKLGGLLSQTAGDDTKRLQEAADELAEARRLDPDDIQSLNEATKVAFEMKDTDLAETLITEVGRRDPANVPMRINLAIAVAASGRPLEAEAILLKVVHDDPNSAIAQRNLGQLQFDLGQYRPAVRHLERAVELNKTYAKVLADLLKNAKRKAATQPASTQPDEPDLGPSPIRPN